MNTSIFSAVEAYVKKDTARFHMPGHKGNLPWLDSLAASGGLSQYDVTEADGCDQLYRPESAIAETERKYTKLYQSAASLLSAGGSTLCIQAILALAVRPGQKLVCGRGCHASAINAMAMLDITPAWVFPETDMATGLAEVVTAAQIGEVLDQNPDAAAVYVTSPDYYGMLCDIKAISEVCRAHGVPLLVDNAHGAYLRFLNPSMHPVNLGADMCADSLHKTLPVLTGGAMLHIGNEKYVSDAKRYMSVFGSTSPSYLILLSIDKALEYLLTDFPGKLRPTVGDVKRLEKTAKDAGFLIPAGKCDPMRLVLGFSSMGYTADEFMRLAREYKIEPEMVAEGFAVFMPSPHNRPGDFALLEKFITELPKKTALPVKIHKTIRPKSVKNLRCSVFAPLEDIPLDNAIGRVMGSVVVPCPPGIPLAVPGELIDENLILYLKNYGISRLNVVK